MFLKKDLSKDEIVLEISGPLNGEPANDFQKYLEDFFHGSQKIITLNLSEVSSINSSCIGKILLFKKKLAEQDRTIRIQGCSDSLYSTFQLIKFDKLLSIER